MQPFTTEMRVETLEQFQYTTRLNLKIRSYTSHKPVEKKETDSRALSSGRGFIIICIIYNLDISQKRYRLSQSSRSTKCYQDDELEKSVMGTTWSTYEKDKKLKSPKS
jgi:hypothetical protein